MCSRASKPECECNISSFGVGLWPQQWAETSYFKSIHHVCVSCVCCGHVIKNWNYVSTDGWTDTAVWNKRRRRISTCRKLSDKQVQRERRQRRRTCLIRWVQNQHNIHTHDGTYEGQMPRVPNESERRQSQSAAERKSDEQRAYFVMNIKLNCCSPK